MMKSEISNLDTFLYFAYSANLLKFWVKKNNPTAEFVSIARLDNFRLDFIRYNSFWGGPMPTIVPTANAHTWGVIWRIHKDGLISLDDQKGIDNKVYFVKYVDVLTPYMGIFKCRSYMQKVYPLPRGNREPIPLENWPSWAYKEVMIMGATEHGLPPCYIRFLKKLKHNGEEGCIRTACLIMRYGKNIPCECRVPGKILRKPLKLDLKKKREDKLAIRSDVVENKKVKKSIKF